MDANVQPDSGMRASEQSARKTLSYQKLVEFIVEQSEKATVDLLFQFACDQFQIDKTHLTETSSKSLKEKIATFFSRFQRKSKERSYHNYRLLSDAWCQNGVIDFYPENKAIPKPGNAKKDSLKIRENLKSPKELNTLKLPMSGNHLTQMLFI